MAESQVVLRFRDGRTERAALLDIDADRETFRVHYADGTPGEVAFREIKAVFFPRVGPDEVLEPATGSTIAVEFADGEVIRGNAHYNPERNGFFLFPLDRSKNDRIYIVNAAIVSIEVEKL